MAHAAASSLGQLNFETGDIQRPAVYLVLPLATVQSVLGGASEPVTTDHGSATGVLTRHGSHVAVCHAVVAADANGLDALALPRGFMDSAPHSRAKRHTSTGATGAGGAR